MATPNASRSIDGTTADHQDTAQEVAIKPERVALADTIVHCDSCGLLVADVDEDKQSRSVWKPSASGTRSALSWPMKCSRGFSRIAAIAEPS